MRVMPGADSVVAVTESLQVLTGVPLGVPIVLVAVSLGEVEGALRGVPLEGGCQGGRLEGVLRWEPLEVAHQVGLHPGALVGLSPMH